MASVFNDGEPRVSNFPIKYFSSGERSDGIVLAPDDESGSSDFCKMAETDLETTGLFHENIIEVIERELLTEPIVETLDTYDEDIDFVEKEDDEEDFE